LVLDFFIGVHDVFIVLIAVQIGSYKGYHSQGFPETHWICNDTPVERLGFFGYMYSGNFIEETGILSINSIAIGDMGLLTKIPGQYVSPPTYHIGCLQKSNLVPSEA
jgi:hypothetical protein